MMGSGEAVGSVLVLVRYECLHSIIFLQLRHSLGIGVFLERVFRYPSSCLQLSSSAVFFVSTFSRIDLGGSVSAQVSTTAGCGGRINSSARFLEICLEYV